MMEIDLSAVQARLAELGLDGWLLYDVHGSNPVAATLTNLPGLLTRRWFCWLPAQGEVAWLFAAVEPGPFATQKGRKFVYRSWQELGAHLGTMLGAARRIAMEYFPGGGLPQISKVDAGTLEMVRALGMEICSSVDLVQTFLAGWSTSGYEAHLRAGQILGEIVQQAFEVIGQRIKAQGRVSEREVQQFIVQAYQEQGLVCPDEPIVATGANSGNPHYVPPAQNSAYITPGSNVLIDVWAKEDSVTAIYADITWVGFAGEPTSKFCRIWELVKQARDAVVQAIRERHQTGRRMQGWEADQVARALIEQHGYGSAFLHRTGHSLGRQAHDLGANLDNLETHDVRELLPGTGFSVEPGIYLPEFGIRSEINVYMSNRDATVTSPIQQEIVSIL